MSVLKFKKVNCKNCYKCIRYCPVKAIEVKNHQAQINERDCIICGNCSIICPQNAKEDVNNVSKIKTLMREGKNIIATIAPSYVADFEPLNFPELSELLKKVGFSEVRETAEGAYLVKIEYEKLVHTRWNNTIVSSCCPTVVKYVQKHYPKALPYLAPVVSPMEASARLIRESHKDSTIVFIGPCISKKAECKEENMVTDFVITFEELKQWIKESDIEITISGKPNEERYKSRLFPSKGGIIATMEKEPEFSYLAIDGLENCMVALKEIVEGRVQNCFVEMSACNGSCLGGPYFQKYKTSILSSYIRVEKDALEKENQKDYDVSEEIDLKQERKDEEIVYMKPSEKQILGILKKMGKNSEEEELNCGTCGYSTCREKALAVYWGKAEINMCLPLMMKRAESFSDKIINVTPNLVLAVDMDLNVQQINKAACDIFGITNDKDIIGHPVSRILDEFDFVNMITNSLNNMRKLNFLVEYNVYLEQTFLYDKNSSIIVCIMKNITGEKKKKNKIKEEKLKAAKIADDIVEKQLRIVHEIASLLGETAAETKIAVTDLKDTILMDDDN